MPSGNFTELFSQNVKGAFCAQGHSAGSSALAYSMSHYGIDRLDHVELVSGPVMSDLKQGCENPLRPRLRWCPATGQSLPMDLNT